MDSKERAVNPPNFWIWMNPWLELYEVHDSVIKMYQHEQEKAHKHPMTILTDLSPFKNHDKTAYSVPAWSIIDVPKLDLPITSNGITWVYPHIPHEQVMKDLQATLQKHNERSIPIITDLVSFFVTDKKEYHVPAWSIVEVEHIAHPLICSGHLWVFSKSFVSIKTTDAGCITVGLLSKEAGAGPYGFFEADLDLHVYFLPYVKLQSDLNAGRNVRLGGANFSGTITDMNGTRRVL